MSKSISFFSVIIIIFLVVVFRGVFFTKKDVVVDDNLNPQKNTSQRQQMEEKIPDDAEMVVLKKPKSNETISSPLKIEGEARGNWFFEGIFLIKLTDKEGNVLSQSNAKALSDWMTTKFVSFESEIIFDKKNFSEGILVFEKSNPSGIPENNQSFKLPVFFDFSEETSIEVYFGKSRSDSQNEDCNKVYPVTRKVKKVQKIGQSAIEQLLVGPTDEEKEDGYFTSIPEDVQLMGLSIQHGIAFVDFNDKLDQEADKSCRSVMIRAQITETLKQFLNVDDVQIYIGSRIEDVL
ncbi:MAG: hypothetical protein ACD_11C00018G0001 [uncultured bacterium]|nr:MAG: hypothetical protein ACD_11C00018G0001 [uncultured bacterium]HBR71527.1 hypothetical protein [Candidatus Moranbacteria bacterium]